MGRYLVVAHQTAQSPELLNELQELLRADEHATFVLLVPATPVGYLLSWEEGEALELARQRAEAARVSLEVAGIRIHETHVGSPDPFEAVQHELHRHRYAAVVISTLPPGLSEWLKTDLPEQVARRHPHLKVVHVVSRPAAVRVDWRRTAAYVGGVAAAVAFEIIEWPIAVLLVGFPLVRMLNRRRLPPVARLAIEAVEDVARPVVGEAMGATALIRTLPPAPASPPPRATPAAAWRRRSPESGRSRGVPGEQPSARRSGSRPSS